MGDPSEQKSIPKEIWDLFASTKLTILLLILLAAASLFNIAVGEYLRRAVPPFQSLHVALGETQYVWFKRLGLLRPYSSWWYATLLGMLCLSLFVCSINRLKSTVRLAFSVNFRRSPDAIRKLAHAQELGVQGVLDQEVTRLHRLLRKRLYRTAELAEDGVYYVAARKGGIARLGALFTHVGIIALLIGGIIGARTGYRTIRYGHMGDVLDVPRRTFKVRVDSLWLDLTADGHIKDWYSKLTVLDPDSVTTHITQVNDPLQYQGIAFYQTYWDQDARHIDQAHLVVHYKETGGHQGIIAPFQKWVPLADSTFLNVADFVADFAIDEAGIARSRSRRHANPAIRLEFYKGGQMLGHQWLFLNYPEIHSQEDSPYQFEWLGYEPIYVTGLQLAQNPGSPLIWLGIGIATVGVCLAFFVVHRRIWAIVVPQDNENVRVVIGGASHKNVYGFDREFTGIIQDIKGA